MIINMVLACLLQLLLLLDMTCNRRTPELKILLCWSKTPFSPRVADDEALLEVIVAHGSDGMAAQLLVGRLRHHHLAGPGNLRCLEARQDSKTEDKRVAVLDAHLELAQVLGHTGVANDLALLGELVGLVTGLLLEEVMLVVILPNALRAHTYLGHRLDAVPDHRPSILVHAALHKALVVVDEQPAWGEVGEVLVVLHRHLVEGEVEGCCQSVRCAAAEMSLICTPDRSILRYTPKPYASSILPRPQNPS